MDEKKPTTTKKSASSSSTTKRTYTKKTVPAVEKPKAVAAAEPKELEVDPFVEQEKPKQKPAKENPNEKVRVFIPLDPSEQEHVTYIDGSDNGKFFHLQRGKEHELDKGLAENILFRIKTARELEEYVEEKRYKG